MNLKNLSIFGFTKRQLKFLLIIGISNIFRAATILNIGPFYPPEAEEKGLSATLIGFIISSLDFTTFLTTLLYGIFIIRYLGPQLVFSLSTGFTGLSTICLGLVVLLDKYEAFVGLSFLIRIFTGFVDAGCYPSIFTTFSTEFTNNMAVAIGVNELFFGFGGILGPIISGYFIDMSNYTVVNVSLGGIMIFLGICDYLLLPKFGPEVVKSQNHLKIRDILKIVSLPRVFVSLLGLLFTAASIGYITGTLEKHLTKFELSSLHEGIVFTLGMGGVIISPLWGWIYEKTEVRGQFFKGFTATLGTALIVIAFCILGPLPFIPGEHQLWSVCTALVLHGIGIGGSIMTAFPRALDAAVNSGFENNISSQSLISSIYTLTFTLGNGIGPSVSGLLYDAFGFRNGTLFIIVFGILVIALEIILSKVLKK